MKLQYIIIIIILCFSSLCLYTATSDYDPSMVPSQILFSLSNVEQCFDVMIIDDEIRGEGTENFMLTFDTPIDTMAQNPQVSLTPREFGVEITDNDEGE